MIWLNRFLVFMLILCLSRTPIPWGHTHDGMNAGQLASHLQKFHPEGDELPEGWHWHLIPIELATEGAVDQFSLANVEVYDQTPFEISAPGDTNAVSQTNVSSKWKNVSKANAVRQQQTYMRLNVLLI